MARRCYRWCSRWTERTVVAQGTPPCPAFPVRASAKTPMIPHGSECAFGARGGGASRLIEDPRCATTRSTASWIAMTNTTKLRLFVTASSAVTVLLSGCGRSPGTPDEPVPEPRMLRNFESCEAMLDYARTTAMGMALANGEGIDEVWGGVGESKEDASAPQGAEDGGADGGSNGGGGSPGFSDTNVQELGVDEPDVVKTDGQRIVALARGRLFAIDASGMTPSLKGSVELPPGWNHQLFMVGTRALVISQTENWEVDSNATPPEWKGDDAWVEITQLTQVDLSDLVNPRVVNTVYAGGGYVSARMVDSVVRVVLRSQPVGLALRSWWDFLEHGGSESESGSPPDLPPDAVDPGGPDAPGSTGGSEDADGDDDPGVDPTKETPGDGGRRARAKHLRDVVGDDEFEAKKEVAKAKAETHNQAVLDQSTPRNWLPLYVADQPGGGTSDLMMPCEEAMRPGVASGLGVLTVTTVDLSAGLELGATVGIFASGDTVYASEDKLYVATHPWYTIDPEWGDDTVIMPGM